MANAGFDRGSGPRTPFDGLGNLELCDRVGLGSTGPRDRSDCAKWGSEASRLISSDREVAADGCGRLIGPGDCLVAGCPCGGGGGGGRAAVVVDGGARVGYCLAAPPAARLALDADEPIVGRMVRLNRVQRTMNGKGWS